MTLVVVSHDNKMVRDLCSRGIVMRKGQKVFDGPIDEAAALLK